MGTLIVRTAGGVLAIRTADAAPGPDPGELNATHHFTSGKATFGQAIPERVVPAGYAVKVGSLETQCDVLATWADGSAKFAVVTCEPTTDDDQTLGVVPAESGSFTPIIPAASVVLTIGGTAWTATLPNTVSSDLWLDGPLVREWRWVIAPVDGEMNPHPFLRVYFDTRAYSDGQSRVNVAVENCLDLVGATSVTYDVAIAVDEESVFLQASVLHVYLSRWSLVFGVGLTESTIVFDFAPFVAAHAIPAYRTDPSDESYSTDGPLFGILGRGGNTYDNMGTVGGRPEIAPYPDWAARYLVHQSESQREYTIANGCLAGSWPIHIREANGNLVSIDDRPQFWLDSRGQSESYPVDDRPKGDLTFAGSLRPDTAHTPSLAIIPYLVTGDRYLADEVAFWANWGMIYSLPDSAFWGRQGATGITGVEQTRGRGWSLRNLADAAAFLPDADPAKAYFAAKVANNLDFYGDPPSEFGSTLGVQWFTTRNTPPTESVALWEHDYLVWAIDRANKLGFSGGASTRNTIAQFQLDLFQTEGVPPTYAGAYLIEIGDASVVPTVYFTTIAESYAHSNDATPFSGFYGRNARLMLIIAIEQGWSGAQAAYDYLMPQITADMAGSPGWAIEQL